MTVAEGTESEDFMSTFVNVPCREQAVLICHKGRTSTVASDALASHLGHGDTRGTCP